MDRGGLIALAPEGPVALRRSVPMAAGDWLALSGETVAHVLGRRGTIARRAPGRAAGQQAIAANVDVLVAVLGLDRPLRFGRLRRALALAAQGGTEAAVALTKADLADDPDGVRRAVAAAAPGVPVLLVGAREGAGVAEVAALAAPDRTIALLGESGAGKTTLTNALTGAGRATGAVRAGDAKGRHVTTARELLPLPGGGAIVDTPGAARAGRRGGRPRRGLPRPGRARARLPLPRLPARRRARLRRPGRRATRASSPRSGSTPWTPCAARPSRSSCAWTRADAGRPTGASGGRRARR